MGIKASQLIHHLQVLIERHGDLEVFTDVGYDFIGYAEYSADFTGADDSGEPRPVIMLGYSDPPLDEPIDEGEE